MVECAPACVLPNCDGGAQDCDHLSKKFSTDHPYRTRQAAGGGLRFGEDFDGKSDLSHTSFCYRGTVDYNRIPVYIRRAKTIQTFKFKLKQWISTNIPLD